MPAIPELTAPLSDGHVGLRAAAEKDIPEILIAHQDDPQLHLRLGFERPPSGAQLGTLAENADAEREAGRHVSFTILVEQSDTCRGRIAVHHFDWDHLRAELGIWLAPQVRGQGLAPRALRLAAPWLFEECGLARLEMFTETDNEPMLRTARAAGFVNEGVLRSYVRERGTRLDTVVLSLLPTDLERRGRG
jgi:RimJ/RimL family protein N-acetyltransferase